MKKLFLLLAGLLAATSVGAQSAAPTDRSIQTEIIKPGGRPSEVVIIQKSQKPNQIDGKRVTWSGISVQLFKTDNPLQLINPLAPARYGSAEDNTVRDGISKMRDPITGKTVGWKVFSVEF